MQIIEELVKISQEYATDYDSALTLYRALDCDLEKTKEMFSTVGYLSINEMLAIINLSKVK